MYDSQPWLIVNKILECSDYIDHLFFSFSAHPELPFRDGFVVASVQKRDLKRSLTSGCDVKVFFYELIDLCGSEEFSTSDIKGGYPPAAGIVYGVAP